MDCLPVIQQEDALREVEAIQALASNALHTKV